LYGSLDPKVDLTSDDYRDDTALLTLLRYSRGSNYLEAIVLPPSLETEDYVTYTSSGITATSAGARMVTNLSKITLETGYLCTGQEKTDGDTLGHRPYLSFHLYGEVDLYGSASLAIPFEQADWEENTRDTVNLSAGAFRQFTLTYDKTLSARLEALLYPWGEWEEQSQEQTYGLYLYPQLSFQLGEKLTLPVTAVLSPLDQSGSFAVSADWNIYQGFSFLGYLLAEVGGTNDTFETGNVSLYGGMSYTF
ncbi:MAG: hypothetical protein PQJ60_13875, partial [Spirochaetales bacterium]|nr:hypothetical protein [Spirochaetales bacterium]